MNSCFLKAQEVDIHSQFYLAFCFSLWHKLALAVSLYFSLKNIHVQIFPDQLRRSHKMQYHCHAGVEKTGKTGSSLPGNFVIWRKNIKKYITETIPNWREICPAGGKFCQACREIKIFSRLAAVATTSWTILRGYSAATVTGATAHVVAAEYPQRYSQLAAATVVLGYMPPIEPIRRNLDVYI